MKAIIVEDDFIVADHLRLMLNKYDIEIIDIIDNYEEAILSMSEQVDIYFLDIRLATEKSGIEIGEALQKKGIDFIYVTANNEIHTLKQAVKTSPLAYITKPYKESDIIAILEKLKNNQEKSITVMAQMGKKIIPLSKVLYFQSDGAYVEVVTVDKIYRERNSLAAMEEVYGGQFVRVHRSFLVNKDKIDQFKVGIY